MNAALNYRVTDVVTGADLGTVTGAQLIGRPHGEPRRTQYSARILSLVRVYAAGAAD